MKHIIRKPYWNWEKEEKWLNKMSARGLALVDYSWCRYVFEEAPPGNYIYRIELLDFWATHPAGQKYIRFVEETGAEFVSSYMRWVYFRKKAADGPFTLHSDIPSQIAHNKRVRAWWLGFAILELSIGLMNITIGIWPPFHALNFVLGSLLFVIGCAFASWVLQITRKVKRLKKELLIREG
jgi:hypothetical protein